MELTAGKRSTLEPASAVAVDASAPWAESLKRGIAQAAAGQTVSIEPVLDELRASIARMEARKA